MFIEISASATKKRARFLPLPLLLCCEESLCFDLVKEKKIADEVFDLRSLSGAIGCPCPGEPVCRCGFRFGEGGNCVGGYGDCDFHVPCPTCRFLAAFLPF